MHAVGLLGPEQIHVHCNTLSDEDWHLLARAGAKVSISPETELNMGMGRLALGKCRTFGIRPTLSCDIVSLNSGDLFSQMRLALAYHDWRARQLAQTSAPAARRPSGMAALQEAVA